VKRWLHPFAVMVAAATLLTVMLGAWVTSARTAPSIFIFIDQIHSGTGRAAAVLLVVLAVWLMAAHRRGLGLTLLAAALAETAFGEFLAPITHSVLAQVLFALTVTAAVCTSNGWELGPEIVTDQGWPSLRSMAAVTPAFVLAQVTLGVAFRHKAIGFTWHIVGAMVVALLVLILGMCTMQPYPKHRALRPAAIVLLSVALAQVLLGIAAITAEMLAPDNTAPPSVIISTIGHVAVGAATLAASLILAVQIRRNVRKSPQEAEESETAASA
jgi:heme A synthase